MATARISKRTVDAGKAGTKDEYLWDDKLPGFGLKTTPNGVKTFIFAYRMGGREAQKRRTTIGKLGAYTPDEARAKAEELQRMVATGIDPRHAEVERRRQQVELAFDKYAQHFIDDYLKRRWKRSWGIAAGYLTREATPFFGDRPITQISAGDVSALMRTMKGHIASRKNTFAVLRKLFRWAISEGDLAETPMRYMEVPESPPARERVLCDAELVTVWKGAEKIGYPFGPLVQLLMITGQRRQEVSALNWAELDRSTRGWTLPSARAKNGTAHWVPLSDQAVALLDHVAKRQAGQVDDADTAIIWPRRGWVFTSDGKKSVTGYSVAKKRLDKAVAALLAKRAEKAGTEPEAIEGWHFHDLRRTMATGFQRLGIRFEVTEAMLNHVGMSRKGIAGVYQMHDWADEKRDAADRWDRHVEAILAAAQCQDEADGASNIAEDA